MEAKTANIADASVISGTGLETAMSKEEFRNEKLYQTTMHLARKMLSGGLISEDEYRQIDTIFLEKYRPTLGTLFSEFACYFGRKE